MPKRKQGFTLVEISIVLVIIGLIVGGILTGRDLIRASQLRGLISEVEQFQTAANTFRIKYNQLPGDMHILQTAQFGFFTFTGVSAGLYFGNNDGKLGSLAGYFTERFCGEEGSIFFHHLAQAGLIKLANSVVLSTDTASFAGLPVAGNQFMPYDLASYLPESKINSAFFCTSHLTVSQGMFNVPNLNKERNVITLRGPAQAARLSWIEPAISPIELYSIELKTDDGRPLSGRIINNPYDARNSAYTYWNLTANSSVCVFGGASATDLAQTYSVSIANGANAVRCQPMFAF